MGRPSQKQKPPEQVSTREQGSRLSDTGPVSAADLYVIRSNLNAVSRQVEDLERKLRLTESYGANVVNLKRK